jgi:hypothetical protein
MKLQQNIRRILNEETSLQGKLNQLIKSKGIVVASKSVGGIENLTKLLELDLSDVNTQEKLIKNFINFGQFLNVEVSFIEIRTSKTGYRIIDVYYTDDEFNKPIWREVTVSITKQINNFFPFKVRSSGDPVISSDNIKIFIHATQIEVEDDEEEYNDEDVIQESKENEHTSLQSKLYQLIKSKGLKLASRSTGGLENLIKILDLDEEGYDNLIYQHLTENYYPDYDWGPKLHDFYRKDVKKYGIYDFKVKDRLAYSYLGEWDGYDYLYTLVISKWLSNQLTELFNDKWIPTFKRWFEENSGLEVRDIDMEGRYIDLSEQTIRSQSMMGTINESKFFRRRIPLDKIENLLRDYAYEMYYETKSYGQFKYELTLKAVEWIMWDEYKMGWDELPEQEEIEFVTKVSNILDNKIKQLYNYYNKK